MAREIIPHEIKDWSPLPVNEDIWGQLDLSDSERNFGIHKYNDKLWTSGYVGVGRLFNKRQKPITTDGKEHIIVISSQYGMNPWKMLETVMTDDEYEYYLSELDDGEFIFKVFYEQPLIKLAQDTQNDGDLLYAISFINSCYSLCKKGLKKALYRQEENCQSKVRGKINVKKNIRENTSRGRNDRFYCQYIDFTEDTLENRILKSTLMKCKAILSARFEIGSEMVQRIAFCMNAFRRVKSIRIKSSDFNVASASGLYMYYKPLLRQARCIYSQKYYSYAAQNGETITKSVYTVPYMINMERLFEFYARTIIKHVLEGSQYYLDSYSKRIFLQEGVTRMDEAERHIHLMPYCIPDILICNKEDYSPVLVMDAKYKSHTRSARSDSHQLLAYVLLTKVKKCGFIFPGETTLVKTMSSGDDHLMIANNDIAYYELLLGNDGLEQGIQQLLRVL